MEIRPATVSDTDALSSLWKSCDLTRPWNDTASDIQLALTARESTILVGEFDDKIISSVMCGFDGHRGWLYYVAVHPDHQKKGLSRKMTVAGEDWLRERGCPKVEVIIREGNKAVQSIYEKLDYKVEPRVLMSKWLKQPPAPHTDTTPEIRVAITYLEMTERPTKVPAPLPSIGKPVSLTRIHDMTVGFFRYLYTSVGEPWLWWEKRVMSDEDLHNFINRDGVEFYVLNVGGVPAGFAQFTFAPAYDNGAEISYFGLLPDFLGMKLGPYLLDWAVETCWAHPTKPERVYLDTCTMDHPAALPNYQKSGFIPYNQEVITIPDPRARGIIPKDIQLAQPEPAV